jgi:hypothetical protein
VILLDASSAPITFGDLTPLLTFAGAIGGVLVSWAMLRAQVQQLRDELLATRTDMREIRSSLADIAKIGEHDRRLGALEEARRDHDTRIGALDRSLARIRGAAEAARRHDSSPSIPMPDEDSDKHR